MSVSCSGYPDQRALAQGLLAGCQEKCEQAWRCFDKLYGNRLLLQAKSLIKQIPVLHSRMTGEDLVQGFLADKVMPDREAYFGKVARGEAKEFWSLLKISLTNYSIDAARLRQPPVSFSDTVEGEGDEDQGAVPTRRIESEEVTTETELRYRRLMSIVHLQHNSYKNHAHYLAVLLIERLHIVRAIGELTVDLSEYGIKPIELAEALVCWPPSVGKMLFISCGQSLNAVWETLRSRVLCYDLPARGELAKVLGVERNTLDQWISRGRKVIYAGAPSEIVKLAPHWFSKGTK
jgi:hypothetical protein